LYDGAAARSRLGAVSTFRYVLVDVFTDTPLAGNALAVFTDAREIPEESLQMLARETNLSETVFVYPPTVEDAHAKIRIFTPGVEVPFAGHPTLGAAFVLAGPLQLMEIRLETGRGVVPVLVEREGARIVFGRMAQPIPTIAAFEDTALLFEALGVGGSELPVEVYDNGLQHLFVTLGSPAEVAALKPDFGALPELGSARDQHDAVRDDWKTRMFIPAAGRGSGDRLGQAARSRSTSAARWIPRRGDRDSRASRRPTLYARVGRQRGAHRGSRGRGCAVSSRGELALARGRHVRIDTCGVVMDCPGCRKRLERDGQVPAARPPVRARSGRRRGSVERLRVARDEVRFSFKTATARRWEPRPLVPGTPGAGDHERRLVLTTATTVEPAPAAAMSSGSETALYSARTACRPQARARSPVEVDEGEPVGRTAITLRGLRGSR
jgi:trans-2,3-dihydro-3-hydroxyanthranilate isomerase